MGQRLKNLRAYIDTAVIGIEVRFIDVALVPVPIYIRVYANEPFLTMIAISLCAGNALFVVAP